MQIKYRSKKYDFIYKKSITVGIEICSFMIGKWLNGTKLNFTPPFANQRSY